MQDSEKVFHELALHLRRLERQTPVLSDKIRTMDAYREFRRRTRRLFLKSLGGLPRKTPLNARAVGKLERDGYAVEKVLFESRPGFLVTGNLYVPDNIQAQAPAIFSMPGHAPEGKAGRDNYQDFYIPFARAGFIVFVIDPPGQGERGKYYEPTTGNEHFTAGYQMYLTGANFAQHYVWDSIRAIDYLVSRREVDAKRIAVTGVSGGGMATYYLAALENRVSAFVPVCMLTTCEDFWQSGPVWAAHPELYPDGLLAAGVGPAELAAAAFPRPILIISAQEDFMPAAGAQRISRAVSRMYRHLGRAESAGFFLAPGKHAYGPEARTACLKFLRRHFGMADASVPSWEVRYETPDALSCTQGRSVIKEGSPTVWSLNASHADDLVCSRGDLTAASLKRAVRRVLRLPSGVELRKIGETEGRSRGRAWREVTLTPDGVIPVSGRLYAGHPGRADEWTVILARDGADGAERLGEGGVGCAGNRCVLECRGTGRTRRRVEERDGYYTWFGSESRLASFYLLAGRTLLGCRVAELLSALDALLPEARKISIWGEAELGLVGLFGAVFDRRIAEVSLDGCPSSFLEIVRRVDTPYAASVILPGVLKHFDIPDVIEFLLERGTAVLPTADPSMPEGPPRSSRRGHDRVNTR